MSRIEVNNEELYHRILVIKLGALGDFVLALGPCAAIRRHHQNAHITLLTTTPFVDLASASGYFNIEKKTVRLRWNNFPG